MKIYRIYFEITVDSRWYFGKSRKNIPYFKKKQNFPLKIWVLVETQLGKLDLKTPKVILKIYYQIIFYCKTKSFSVEQLITEFQKNCFVSSSKCKIAETKHISNGKTITEIPTKSRKDLDRKDKPKSILATLENSLQNLLDH